jgi:hypothetical protein
LRAQAGPSPSQNLSVPRSRRESQAAAGAVIKAFYPGNQSARGAPRARNEEDEPDAARGEGAEILGRYRRRTQDVDDVIVNAHVHGASTCDVGKITAALIGEQVGRSPLAGEPGGEVAVLTYPMLAVSLRGHGVAGSNSVSPSHLRSGRR